MSGESRNSLCWCGSARKQKRCHGDQKPRTTSLGLRFEHYASILEGRPEVDWFEAITENYLVPGGRPLHNLMRVRERFPVALHGVSLSIGSISPLELNN